MKLRSKVLCGVVLGIAGLSAGLYVATGEVVMSGFLRSERHDADAGTAQTRAIVATMLDEYLVRMNDWANWDDMARFVENGNQEFVTANIEASVLAGLQWDTFLVTRPGEGDRALVALDTERAAMATPDPHLVERLRDPTTHGRCGASRVGLLVVDDTIWITASRDVANTDGSPAKVPGRFATCSRVNDGWLARLRKFTSRDVVFRRAAQAPADALEATARERLATEPHGVVTLTVADDRISSFTWLGDVHGKPAVLVRENRPRPLLAQGRSILGWSLLTIAAGGAVLIVLALAGTSRVLRRLYELQAGVDALDRGAATPVVVTSRDEIGTLAQAFNAMSARILDRERALTTVNRRLQVVLDSIGDGLLACGLDGNIEGDVSRRAREWFGPADGKKVWDYLFGDDDARRTDFQLGWAQLVDDVLPFELARDQMPRRCCRGERCWEIRCERIERDGQFTGVLLIVADVTAAVANEQAQREAAEMQAIVANFVRDPDDFERFLAEMDGLLERIVHGTDEAQARRQLHTMKGNAAVYGLADFADACHGAENALAEGQALALCTGPLQDSWRRAMRRVRSLLPGDGQLRVHLGVDEYERFLGRLCAGDSADRLLAMATAWRLQPLATIFARFGRQAQRTAAKLGKQVEVACAHGGLRCDAEALAGFWDAFVHVVRNAVDHGIEAGELRRALGKPASGRLRFATSIDAGHLAISLGDDGAGIDWEKLASAAARRGLPHRSHDELVAALFADGVSTRDEVGECSGRGVGMAAVREATHELGGTIDVMSKRGAGTTFVFRLPLAVCLGAKVAARR